jgi:hypothetical protein
MTDIAQGPPANVTDALAERLFRATIDTLEIASVHLGGRLGFYRALADGGEATAGELAARTGSAERYVPTHAEHHLRWDQACPCTLQARVRNIRVDRPCSAAPTATRKATVTFSTSSMPVIKLTTAFVP